MEKESVFEVNWTHRELTEKETKLKLEELQRRLEENRDKGDLNESDTIMQEK